MARLFSLILAIVVWPLMAVAQIAGDPDAYPSAGSSQGSGRSGFYVSPNMSTLGFGAEAGMRMSRFFGMRLGGNYMPAEFDREIEEVDYDFDATLASLGAIADLYPFRGGFRISGGVRANFNDAEATGTPAEDQVEIGGEVFDAADVGQLDGDVEYQTFAPYLGIGYGATMNDGALSLGFDLGVMYQGEADVTLDAVGGELGNNEQLQAALADEEEDVEDELDNFEFFPVLSVGLIYRF